MLEIDDIKTIHLSSWSFNWSAVCLILDLKLCWKFWQETALNMCLRLSAWFICFSRYLRWNRRSTAALVCIFWTPSLNIWALWAASIWTYKLVNSEFHSFWNFKLKFLDKSSLIKGNYFYLVGVQLSKKPTTRVPRFFPRPKRSKCFCNFQTQNSRYSRVSRWSRG